MKTYLLGAQDRMIYRFGGRTYTVGDYYHYEELPRKVRQDVLAQADDIEGRFGVPAKELFFKFTVIPKEELLQILRRHYGPRLEAALEDPEIVEEARRIERRGLESPPVGEEGWETALASLLLGRDLPYFQVVEPLDMPFGPSFSPPPPTLEGSRREKGMDPRFREMREGFWRMIQRIHLGIPGFIGTGRVEGHQFTGGLAGIRTAWPLAPGTISMIDAVPVAGFYVFGVLWPQMIRVMGLPGNVSQIIEKLDEEFGTASVYDLMKGTVPYQPPSFPGALPIRTPEEEEREESPEGEESELSGPPYRDRRRFRKLPRAKARGFRLRRL